MYKKTTSIQCLKYCDILDELPEQIPNHNLIKKVYKNKFISELHSYDYPCYVHVDNGIIGVVFMAEDDEYPELYAIHRKLKIKANIKFNFISLTASGKLHLFRHQNSQHTRHAIETFTVDIIKPKFSVTEIFAFYYSTKGNNYYFGLDKHPFWEMTYVDNGELVTTVEGKSYHLPPRSLIFYAPNQVHSQNTTSNTTCSYMTIMFDAKGLDADQLSHRIILSSNFVSQNLSHFMHLSNEKSDNLNEFLPSILKLMITSALSESNENEQQRNINPMQQHYEDELLNEIIQFINQHIHEPLSIEGICDKFAVSRSTLQSLFKRNIKNSPKNYINNLKLEASKILLKNSAKTVSEVSEMLGYTSIHYFSRKFKSEYGISPSEYSKSIID